MKSSSHSPRWTDVEMSTGLFVSGTVIIAEAMASSVGAGAVLVMWASHC